MAAHRQPVLASCAIGAALVLGLGCSSPTPAHLKGTVYLTACGGAAPTNRPGVTPNSTCVSNFVNGAVVVAVPGRVAQWRLDDAGRFVVVSPTAGSALTVRADGKGGYSLDLPAGTYMVGAYADKWQKVESNGFLGIPITTASDFQEVKLGEGAKVSMTITIAFNAA